MKVEVKEAKQAKESPFPKLMIQKESGRIILATGYTPNGSIQATLISDGTTNDNAHYSNDWAESVFQDFEGSITLSND